MDATGIYPVCYFRGFGIFRHAVIHDFESRKPKGSLDFKKISVLSLSFAVNSRRVARRIGFEFNLVLFT